jgi:hypothetical protein
MRLRNPRRVPQRIKADVSQQRGEEETYESDGHTPQGTVTFHEGFKADGKQEGAGEAFQRA